MYIVVGYGSGEERGVSRGIPRDLQKSGWDSKSTGKVVINSGLVFTGDGFV